VRIVEKYIINEVLKPFVVISVILAGLFFSFSGARFLAEAVTETLATSLILKLMLLKTLIAMEVLFPFALYASIIVSMGRMHRDQEISVMRAAGLSEGYIIKILLMIALPLGILVGVYSIYMRPWAYETSYLLDVRSGAELNLDRYQAGRFYGNEESGRIIYIGEKSKENEVSRDVFHYQRGQAHSEIILAREAFQRQPDVFRPPRLHLQDGFMYQMDHAGLEDSVIRFSRFVYIPETDDSVEHRRKATSTFTLMDSDDPRDVAEYQWRLSRGIATILLALAAIPLSRSSPRQGKGEKIFSAAVLFAVYYNLSGLAQSWVEQGIVGKFPGIWWLHGLMFVVVVWILSPRSPARKSVKR